MNTAKPPFEQPLAIEPRSELAFLSYISVIIASLFVDFLVFSVLFGRGDYEISQHLPLIGSWYGVDFNIQLFIVSPLVMLLNLPSAISLLRGFSWHALALGILPYAALVLWAVNE